MLPRVNSFQASFQAETLVAVGRGAGGMGEERENLHGYHHCQRAM